MIWIILLCVIAVGSHIGIALLMAYDAKPKYKKRKPIEVSFR